MWMHRKMRSREKCRPWRRPSPGMAACSVNRAMGFPCFTSLKPRELTILLGMILLMLIPNPVSAQCPIPPGKGHCERQADGKAIINCRYQGLDQVPNWVSTGSTFHELTLANNRITSLSSNAFSGLRITRLDLSANKINSIDPAAFAGLEDNLEELLLHVDGMTVFPTEALERLVNLRYLVIEGFNLTTLPSGALQTQSKIHTLKMEKCQLESVSSGDFAGFKTELVLLSLRNNRLVNIPQSVVSELQNLEIMDVSHNKLVVLPDNLFSGNSKVVMLDFSNNQLQTVRDNAYRGLENSLETLILKSNKLTDNQLRPLRLLRTIKSLNLANNQFISIPADAFLNVQTLESLYLRGNKLANLRKEPFDHLKNSLKSLDLADNLIRSIEAGFFGAFIVLEVIHLDGQDLNGVLNADTFSGLEGSLQRLSIQEAKLTTADWQSVVNLAKLQYLDFANNDIMQIPDFTFAKLTELTTMDVSYNKISSISQRSMHGPQANLSSINLNSNALETIPECTFWKFTALNRIQLNLNPLNCDCDMVWLRKWVDDKYPGNNKFLIYDWKCASPQQLAGQRFYNVSQAQLCPNDATPTPIQCEDLSATTTAMPTAGSTSVTVPPPDKGLPKVTNITHVSAIIRWTLDSEVTGIIVNVLNKNTGENKKSENLPPDAGQYPLTGLAAGTEYTVCVNFVYNNTSRNIQKCKDFTTASEPAAVTGGTNVGAIVGAVIGVLALIALLILLGFLVVRSRTTGDPLFAKPKWLGGGGQNGSAGNTAKSRTPTGIPQIGYNSKRFSRPKSRETATASTTSSQLQNRANSELEMKLAGFSPEERERIINMLTSTGGSTLSMISSGSSQRYVPELPPRPQHLEGYLNPQSIHDDEEDPYKHIYDEIPGADGNYYEQPIHSKNDMRRQSTASVHSGKYEPYPDPQGAACYI